MQPDTVNNLALMVAADPDPNAVARYLGSVTFRDYQATVVTSYIRVPGTESDTVMLVGHRGLVLDEEVKYTQIQPDFPLPAPDALRHYLPYSMTMAHVAERFPLLGVRPELSDGMLLSIPLPVRGITVGAALISLVEQFRWQPTTWQRILAIQAILAMYVRASDHNWTPVRPMSVHTIQRQGLTERQLAVLALVDLGKSTSSIAARLGFSEATIKTDLRRAMHTLQVSDRRQAVARATELGFLDSAAVN